MNSPQAILCLFIHVGVVMRRLQTACVSAVFAALAITSLIASCSGSSPPSPETKSRLSQSDLEEQDILRPDKALIIVRNLESWWEDCGCSGTAVGGVQRMPSAALGANEVRFALVGRSVLPHDGTLAKIDIEASMPFFVELARSVMGRMASYYWFPDARERQLVGNHLEASTSDTIPLAGTRIELTDEEVELVGLGFRSQLSSLANRGREVLVIAVWDRGAGPTIFDKKLSTLAPLSSTSETVAKESREILRSATGTVVAAWRRMVTEDLIVSTGLNEQTGGMGLSFVHMPGVSKISTPIPIKLDPTTEAHQYDTCGRCHESAWKKWLQTSHAVAMPTLASRLREHDPRCLTCHVSKTTAINGKTQAIPGHGAVTCQSCHHGERSAADMCTDCHTAHTDPSKHYMKALQTICTPAKNANASDPCPMR